MGVVETKNGVSFDKIAPGGFRILSAIDQAAAKFDMDLVITSACDGTHSGPNDPHKRGEAIDLRSKTFNSEQKSLLLNMIMRILGWDYFYGFLESPNTDNEHFHFQVKKGTKYPPEEVESGTT